MLSAEAYLELLIRQHENAVPLLPGTTGPNDGQRSHIRALQTGNTGIYAAAAKEENELIASLNLPENASAADVVRIYLRDQLHKPLIDSLDAQERVRLEVVPVGLLTLRMLNARAFKSPNGDPVIVMNQGLLNLLSEYKEMQMEAAFLSDQEGREFAEKYERSCYRFLLKQFDSISPFDNNSMLATPAELLEVKARVRMPEHAMWANQMTYMGAEMFVLAHEFAHVAAGHLDTADTRSVGPDGGSPSSTSTTLSCYKLSWQQEYEADRLGYLHFLKAWPVSSTREISPIEIIAPLTFFELLHLVECNLPRPDAYGTHPPAWRRAVALLQVTKREYRLLAPENANLRALCASFRRHLLAIQQLEIWRDND
ncbi:hypothetical protein ACFWPU_15880 [Streptomyces sp. NPDC058471]|uniref:hypothetical protein n=1 Tax=Streptomyces sp. NPDC058471 TaxID=3346516 RepID=UPI0036502EA1